MLFLFIKERVVKNISFILINFCYVYEVDYEVDFYFVEFMKWIMFLVIFFLGSGDSMNNNFLNLFFFSVGFGMKFIWLLLFMFYKFLVMVFVFFEFFGSMYFLVFM